MEVKLPRRSTKEKDDPNYITLTFSPQVLILNYSPFKD